MKDCIVIGAGFSGLAAATALKETDKDVVVLETGATVGGRVRHTDHKGQRIELGARYFGEDQTEVMALVDAFGLKKLPSAKGGDMIVVDGEGRHRMSMEDMEGQSGLEEIYGTLEELAAKLDPADVNAHPDAKALDGISLKDWLLQQGADDDAIEEMRGFCHGLLSSEPEDVSVLAFVWYAAGSGGLFHAVDFDNGLLKYTAAETLSEIVIRQAEALGDNVHLGTTVTAVRQVDGGYEVITDNGSYFGRQIIVALPPKAAARLEYPDTVSDTQRDAMAAFEPGNAFDCFAVFPTPFWKERGLSGTTLGKGLISTTFDVSNATHQEGILDCMISPEKSAEFALLSEAEQKAAIVSDIRSYFDNPSLDPEEIFIGNWHDEAPSYGAFGWKLAPGYFAKHYAALRQRVSGIHFAGTEQADAFPGYVEGAIRAGKAAANRVEAALAEG